MSPWLNPSTLSFSPAKNSQTDLVLALLESHDFLVAADIVDLGQIIEVGISIEKRPVLASRARPRRSPPSPDTP